MKKYRNVGVVRSPMEYFGEGLIDVGEWRISLLGILILHLSRE